MTNDYYKIGSWNVICDNCGKKYKREQVKKTWDGYMMCLPRKCWYPKHPNDNPRKIIPDGLPVPDARPRQTATNWTYLPVLPITKWTDATLTWNDPNWLWNDDPSTLILFQTGNP